MSAPPPADNSNIATVTDSNFSYRIIITGFGIIGALAALFVLHPEETSENIVAAAIGGIIGFIAGRKK